MDEMSTTFYFSVELSVMLLLVWSLVTRHHRTSMRRFFDENGCMICKKDHSCEFNGMCKA
jgi:hypothetical protein